MQLHAIPHFPTLFRLPSTSPHSCFLSSHPVPRLLPLSHIFPPYPILLPLHPIPAFLPPTPFRLPSTPSPLSLPSSLHHFSTLPLTIAPSLSHIFLPLPPPPHTPISLPSLLPPAKTPLFPSSQSLPAHSPCTAL